MGQHPAVGREHQVLDPESFPAQAMQLPAARGGPDVDPLLTVTARGHDPAVRRVNYGLDGLTILEPLGAQACESALGQRVAEAIDSRRCLVRATAGVHEFRLGGQRNREKPGQVSLWESRQPVWICR